MLSLRLIEDTLAEVDTILKQYRSPAIYASFGKDSTVLVHLLKHFRLPIICHRPPTQPGKWAYANRMIEDWSLEVYDWPPERVALQERDDSLYIVSAYSAGHNAQQLIVQRTMQHCGTSSLDANEVCGLDALRRPIAKFDIAWDVAFCAQKNGDPGIGKEPMKIDIALHQRVNALDVAFPLRNWTDGDIYEYLVKYKVPMDGNRYDVDGAKSRGLLVEKSSKELNGDVIGGCFNCVRRGEKDSVICPKLGGIKINSIADKVPYIDHDNNHIT